MVDDTEGVGNDPDAVCTPCPKDRPGSLRIFFIHDFDDTPIPNMDVQIATNVETVTHTTDANGMVSLNGVSPGRVAVRESNIRKDLPDQATRTQPNNRYFADRAAVAWMQSTNGGHDRAHVIENGASSDSTVVVSDKTTYMVYRKRKVYEIGIFAHVENKPAADLRIGDVIGHTFLTVQVPGPNGSLGTHEKAFSGGLFGSDVTISYSGEIARGFWPAEALEQKALITGVEGKVVDEIAETAYFDASARAWAAGQGPPHYHAASRFFEVDYTVAIRLLDRMADLEHDPPDYVIARTFRGVVTRRQSIGQAVGAGEHCSTFALASLEGVGISVPTTSFASPASIIESINGVDIPNNDDDVMNRIQDEIIALYDGAPPGAGLKSWLND